MSRRGSRRGPRSFGEVSLGLCTLALMIFLVIGPIAVVALSVSMFIFPEHMRFYAEWCIRISVTWFVALFIMIVLERLINE